MNNICVALTNRTNYSKLKTVLFELRQYKNIRCRIVLSSTILLDRFGGGYQDLLRDGFEIDKQIDCALMNDSHEAMAKTVGLPVGIAAVRLLLGKIPDRGVMIPVTESICRQVLSELEEYGICFKEHTVQLT